MHDLHMNEKEVKSVMCCYADRTADLTQWAMMGVTVKILSYELYK